MSTRGAPSIAWLDEEIERVRSLSPPYDESMLRLLGYLRSLRTRVGREPETVRHLKRGGTYEVLCRDGDVQMSTRPLVEGDRIVTYRDVATGHWYHRRAEEFDDGRFERLP